MLIGGGKMVVLIWGVRGGLGTELLSGGGKGSDWELLLWTTKLVDDDDVDFLKVLYEGVEIVYLEATARVVATLGSVWVREREGAGGMTHQFVLAVKGGECVEDGAAITLEGRGELGTLEVARAG